MEEENTPTTFDREYVKELRQEAAKYRTEAKELKSQLEEFKSLEAQISTVRVENELIRRGVNADPNWVKLNDGQTPAEAVDNFLEKFPEFKAGAEEPSVERKQVPKAISPNPNKAASADGTPVGALGNRGLNDIKNDPMARGSLRDLYRDLLRTSSNLPD